MTEDNNTQPSLAYRLTRFCVMPLFRAFYRPYVVRGAEHIPQDGSAIFTANHLNAFMDALAIVSITPRKHSSTFLARADLFRQKAVARVLRFVKIMPAYRMRDGIGNLANNNASFSQAEDILRNGNYIGIMPEGAQGEERRMRPLVKGTFRIAFAAQEPYGTEKRIKIIPVGLDMGSLFNFGSHLIINIGQPIEIADYMHEYAENPAMATNRLRNELAHRLHEQTLDLASDKYYGQMETAVYALDHAQCLIEGKTPDTLNRFDARRTLAERLCAIERNQPRQMEQIARAADTLKNGMKQMHLRPWLFACRPHNIWQSASSLLALLITSPIFLIGLLFNILPFFTPVWIRRAIGVQYSGFYSSIQFGIGLFTFPIFYILQLVVIGCLISSNPLFLLAMFILQPIMGKLAFEWWRLMRKTCGMMRYTHLLKTKNSNMTATQEAYTHLSKLLLGKR